MRQRLAACYSRWGRLSQKKGDLANAKAWFESSLALRRALAKELGTPQARDDLALALFRLGTLTEGSNDLLLEAADLWHALSKEFPSVPKYAQHHASACTEIADRSSVGRFFMRIAKKEKGPEG